LRGEEHHAGDLHQITRQLYLVDIELDPGMTDVEWLYFLDAVFLVIIEHLYIKISYEIEIHFVSVIPDAHDEHTILIQHLKLLIERE
jgi:hypothetical protein